MDKDTMFKPTKDEACNFANEYWEKAPEYRVRILKHLSELITANAKLGKYMISAEVLKTEKEYVKNELEKCGYTVSFKDILTDGLNEIIEVSFK